MKTKITRLTVAVLLIAFIAPHATTADHNINFNYPDQRIWTGPELWANPMEYWQVSQGRLECTTAEFSSNIHLLTHELSSNLKPFRMSVRIGKISENWASGSAGFIIGANHEIDSYKARALFGQGINAGINADGTIFIGQAKKNTKIDLNKPVVLKLQAKPESNNYSITLQIWDTEETKMLAEISTKSIPAKKLIGSIALLADKAAIWFDDFSVSGAKIKQYPDRTFGPIIWAMHTLSRGQLNMTAQMPPIGKADSDTVTLQIKNTADWKNIAQAKIDPDARTATFSVKKWNTCENVQYRLVCDYLDSNGKPATHHYSGTVRREPIDRTVVVAGFTGNTDFGFPNLEIARNVKIHDPDVLFFSGDQIYENVGGYGIIREPAEISIVNYLRKWYLLGWAFGDLMKDRVTICLPDDHDVYQGNIWGNGGNKTTIKEHQRGGYAQPAKMVNAVHKTQTSHHPPAYDPTPIKQDISVYYGDMLYGRISFAIIADRMFKSGPKGTIATWDGRPDWVDDKDIDVTKLDKPNLNLLGDRQEKFLSHWVTDFKGSDMKCVLSQTIFCNLANYHGAKKMFLIADLDSNGWPQSKRNKALDIMRRGFAFHLAGDQHLASIVHHGIDKHGDAGYSFCVPSIAAGYPRSWQPDKEGKPILNRPDRALANTGDYLDGLLNKVTVHAVGNPEPKNRPGKINILHDKASGYGIVRFDKDEQTMTMECYKLQIDAANPKPQDQFPGWPKTISTEDNYARDAIAWLPEIIVEGLKNPVIQIIEESTGDTIYTLRIKGSKFQPKVFNPGKYTIKAGNPDDCNMKTQKGISANIDKNKAGNLKMNF
jgi:phosphodiesterase/alkaline phosphatase D-like protein